MRPLGFPRKRWIEGVDKTLEKRGKSIREVEVHLCMWMH